jgi:histidyl-tRNA synthetase
MSSLSLQGYRGTRDFYPDEQRARQWIYSKMREALMSFGYEEYQGPIVEPFELYAAKSSEEIVSEQLYHMVDRGDRRIAIRPEMTPTLARMVAARFGQLPRPIRWFSIPTCMRYERPQRGRLREFDQLNVDVFGGQALDEDIETLLTSAQLLLSLGATHEDFLIRINHRGVVNDFLYKELGLDENLKSPLLRLLDKRDKITAEAFAEEALNLGVPSEKLPNLEKFLSCSIDVLPELLPNHSENTRALMERFEVLRSLLPERCFRFDASVMRGFDYYTGLVFEVYDTNPENRRALFGGGRYDNLVGAFGVDPLPGIGYGVGDVGLLNFCEVHKLFPHFQKPTDLCVVRFSTEDRMQALELSQLLRSVGLKVESPLSGQKFGKQIQAAEKTGAKAVAFRGSDELANGTFSVKVLSTGVQKQFPMTASGAQTLLLEIRDLSNEE